MYLLMLGTREYLCSLSSVQNIATSSSASPSELNGEQGLHDPADGVTFAPFFSPLSCLAHHDDHGYNKILIADYDAPFNKKFNKNLRHNF